MLKIKKNQYGRFSWKLLLPILLCLLLILGALELFNVTNFYHSGAPAAEVVVTAGKPDAKPKTSTSESSGSNQEKIPTSNNSSNNGGAVDNQGVQEQTDSQQWTTSKSGVITVKQPAANATLKNGSIVSGSAQLSEVQYRLIDDLKGVLATGPISVVDGNFSASLKFTNTAQSGRLDVFSYDPTNSGREINEVQIYVRF